MAISTEERRFLRSWEEQREGGKWQFVSTYSVGYTLLFFLSSVTIGLFSSIPFIKINILIGIGLFSVFAGILASLFFWKTNQKKFRRIILREIGSLQ